MYQQPTTPQPIGVVLDNAKQLYRSSFRSCWVLSLIGSIAFAASDLYMTAPMGDTSLTDPQALHNALRALAAYGSAGALESDIVVSLVMLVVYSALLAQMHRIAQGHTAYSPVDALGVALRRLPGSILAAIIFALGVGGTLLLSVAPAYWLWTKPQFWVAALLVFVLLVTAGTYLWGKLQFWIVAVFADGVGAIESLGRSWSVTQGHWWRSNTILGAALTIVLVLELLADLLVGVLAMGGSLFPAAILRAITQVFLLPMFPAALLAIYYDLRLRREAGAAPP
jgi:hypothetical protein